MNDMSGTYCGLSGQGSVIAARMAVEDFGAAAKGMKVEILGADHQNKPDVGSNVVRTWIDVDKVDVIVDVPTSSVALAVNEIVRDKNKVFLVSGAAASDLTGPKCTPNTIHWTYDTWALANGTGKAIVKTGGDTWFFLTADYAFGHALEHDTAAVVKKNGGKVLGKVRHPFPGTDFSSFLLQAQASKAKIIGLANAGADTINSIKQASEFGITQSGQNLAALLAFITDVHALGLQTAQGLIMTEAWYWDLNDANREFAKKFAPQDKGVHPDAGSWGDGMLPPPAGDVISHVRTARHQLAGPVRPAANRLNQRLVLCVAQPRACRHLRYAQHHQLHAWRPIHAGRLHRVLSSAIRRTGLLVGDRPFAVRRRTNRDHRPAAVSSLALPARSSLRASAHLRSRAHLRRHFS